MLCTLIHLSDISLFSVNETLFDIYNLFAVFVVLVNSNNPDKHICLFSRNTIYTLQYNFCAFMNVKHWTWMDFIR